MILLLLRK